MMSEERWQLLMTVETDPLTPEEIAEGWHFCIDWDGLLIGPEMGEADFCTCQETESYQEWTERRCREFPCDICGGDACETHHIARGQNKRKAKREVCCVLHLCRPCHDLKVHKGMEVAEQLAWLKSRRPGEFDIEAFYSITGRRWPDATAVWRHYRRIMDQLLNQGE